MVDSSLDAAPFADRPPFACESDDDDDDDDDDDCLPISAPIAPVSRACQYTATVADGQVDDKDCNSVSNRAQGHYDSNPVHAANAR